MNRAVIISATAAGAAILAAATVAGVAVVNAAAPIEQTGQTRTITADPVAQTGPVAGTVRLPEVKDPSKAPGPADPIVIQAPAQGGQGNGNQPATRDDEGDETYQDDKGDETYQDDEGDETYQDDKGDETYQDDEGDETYQDDEGDEDEGNEDEGDDDEEGDDDDD